MSRTKTILILVLLIGFGSLAIYLNKDWFAKRTIQISHRVSPWMQDTRRGRGRPDLGTPVTFQLDSYYRLTSVKVVIAADIATNRFAHPLWELVTTSNSIPTATFAYGERLRGMTPATKGAVADPLDPQVKYRLIIKAQGLEAHHDFTTQPAHLPQ